MKQICKLCQIWCEQYVGSEGNVIYLRTSENANNYKIVSVDISNPSNLVWTTIVQEDERNILETAYHVAG